MSSAATETITFDHRFHGPPQSANGGYAAGRLAAFLDGTAEVTLRLPPPLDRPLAVERRDDRSVILLDGDAIVAEAAAADVELELQGPVSMADARRAAKRSLAFDPKTQFRTCFVCGTDREPGDGLNIFPGPADGRDLVAAPWAPPADLADGHGRVLPEFVWAALDCPSGFAVGIDAETIALLGRFSAKLVGPVEAARPYVVVGWSAGAEGRRLFGGSALYGDDGSLLAYAKSTWVKVEPK